MSGPKSISWALRGTTRDVRNVLDKVQRGVRAIPELEQKVRKGEIIGDPHTTKSKDGRVDPMHVSGLLGTGNLKRSNRATSFHFYIETGDLVFSDPKYPKLRITGNATSGGDDSIPSHQKASDWVWDNYYKKWRYHNGQEWIYQEGEGSGT